MDVQHDDLIKASKNKIITPEQAKQLWNYLVEIQGDNPRFEFSHVMYYFGGFLAISAVTVFVTLSWEDLQGIGLLILSIGLFLLGSYFIRHFLRKKLVIPAGIMSVFCVALVPLAIYNIQLTFGWFPNPTIHYRGFYSWVSGFWVPMELGTVLVAAVMLYRYQFAFLIFPMAFSLWFLSMDLYGLFFPLDDFHSKALFSLYFGLLILCAALYMDYNYYDNSKQDYAYWLYLFGVITFWSGLTFQCSTDELNKLIYCFINLLLIITGVVLNRRVFAVFGAFGVFGYLTHLSVTVFADSYGFPFVLIGLGILIMLAASRWAKVEKKLLVLLRPYLPEKILSRH